MRTGIRWSDLEFNAPRGPRLRPTPALNLLSLPHVLLPPPAIEEKINENHIQEDIIKQLQWKSDKKVLLRR